MPRDNDWLAPHNRTPRAMLTDAHSWLHRNGALAVIAVGLGFGFGVMAVVYAGVRIVSWTIGWR